MGFNAMPNHPLGGAVLTPALAEKAVMGYHGLIITPQFGPRVRLSAIFTGIENLPIREINEHRWIAEFCKKCKKCVREYPGGAIFTEPYANENGLLKYIDEEKCFRVFAENHGCSLCIKECVFNNKEYSLIKNLFEKRNELNTAYGGVFMKIFKITILALIISLCIVGISPLATRVTITSQNQLDKVRTGFPFPFIEQKLFLTPPENYYPFHVTILSPWENPTKILWGNYFLSVIAVGFIVWIVVWLFFGRKGKKRYNWM